MSGTSYFVQWSPVNNVVVQIHLGSITSKDALLNGKMFPSWSSMRTFLAHNRYDINILDDMGIELDFTALVHIVESMSQEKRRFHYQMMSLNHPENISYEASTQSGMCWIDADGFSMYNGDFS